MNAGTTLGISREEKGAAWRAILIFLALTTAFSAIFDGIMIHQGVSSLLMVTGVMWSPGMAAIVTCLILKRPIASLPWRWGGWKLSWFAYLLPLAYALAMYLPVWLGHLGGSSFGAPDALRTFAGLVTGNLPEGAAVPAGAVAAGVLITGTVGMIDKASRALGEEIGWRGFLIWEMRKVMPFWAVGLLSGFIWSLWHWPGILFTDYNAGEGNLVVQMILFTLSVMPMGVVYAWLAFRSGSLWPAAILHASHNLFLQRVFTPLTAQGEGTHIYIDEFGILLPVVSVLLAAIFLWKARKDGL